jgi:hypothetical protein
MAEKKHIEKFIAEISNTELMQGVEQSLNRQMGLPFAEETVVDKLYELYFEPLCGPGATSRFASEDFVFRELGKRIFNDPWLKMEFELRSSQNN